MPNPFELLGLEPAFAIDMQRAEENHRNLSRTLHPDRYTTAPSAERREALNRAIAVNEAWRQIRQPVSRAEALLQVMGLSLGEGSPTAGSGFSGNPEFLMQMMEQREALAAAIAARDLDAVHRLSEAVRTNEQRAASELAQLFEQALQDPSGADKTQLNSKLGELRFFKRFLDEAAAAEDELF